MIVRRPLYNYTPAAVRLASPCRDVETGLVNFVFHVAGAQLSQVAQHLCENVFDQWRPHLTLLVAFGVDNAIEAVVADVEGGAKAMAAVFGSIDIHASQFFHVMLRAQHRSDKQFIDREALHAERVGEVACNLVEQACCPWHEIGRAVAEAVDAIERIVADIDQSAFFVLRCLAVGDAADAQALGRQQLHIVEVGETSFVVTHASHLVLHRSALGIGEFQRFAWCREQSVDALAVDDDGVVSDIVDGFVADVATICARTSADEAAREQCSQGQLKI